jgi:hypothetical protein
MAAKYWRSKRGADALLGHSSGGAAACHEDSDLWRAAHRPSNASSGGTSAELLRGSRCGRGWQCRCEVLLQLQLDSSKIYSQMMACLEVQGEALMVNLVQ